MKFKLIMAGLAVIVLLSQLACSPSSEEEASATVGIPCNAFIEQKHISEQVEFTAGEWFTVTLCSNPTTGFRWDEEAQISDTGVLKQVQHEFIGPESEPPPPPGTPGQQVWSFRTLKEGTATVSLEYSRPWEGGEKGEWTYTLTVTVK